MFEPAKFRALWFAVSSSARADGPIGGLGVAGLAAIAAAANVEELTIRKAVVCGSANWILCDDHKGETVNASSLTNVTLANFFTRPSSAVAFGESYRQSAQMDSWNTRP